ncbi:MAG: hypothetical protein JWQ42_4505 [Edaphobacter sp.]|nr:hypothetical protein [Edaphobacter sp.]
MPKLGKAAIIGPAVRLNKGPLSQVDILLHPHPAAPESVATTDGQRIFLNPLHHRLDATHWLYVLGHEFAHLMQQRQGRVRPSGARQGTFYNDDIELEREADLLAPSFAVLFAAGLCPVLPPWAGSAPAASILQHMISIRGRSVRSQVDLVPMAQSLLQMIPSGAPWLASIAAAKTQYQFGNDLELLAGIHAGVHGDSVMLLRKLQIAVHPEALADFKKDDIDSMVLVEREAGDNSVARMRVRRLLASQQLLTESELKVGDDFPSQVGLPAESLFRSASLSARIALFNLVNEGITEHALDTKLQAEAADFAIQRSLNVFEFVDYYRFFMALIGEPSPDPLQAPKRARFAEATADSLSNVIFDLLWVPTLDSVPSASAMPGLIAKWSEGGFKLGFQRLSAALAHLAQHVPTQGATGVAARQIIADAMAQLQTQWVSNVPRSVRVTQTGLERLYTYDLPAATAQISLAADGTLTIGDYRPRSALSTTT